MILFMICMGWWWVLSPFWIPLAIVLGIFAVVGVGVVVAAMFKK